MLPASRVAKSHAAHTDAGNLKLRIAQFYIFHSALLFPFTADCVSGSFHYYSAYPAKMSNTYDVSGTMPRRHLYFFTKIIESSLAISTPLFIIQITI